MQIQQQQKFFRPSYLQEQQREQQDLLYQQQNNALQEEQIAQHVQQQQKQESMDYREQAGSFVQQDQSIYPLQQQREPLEKQEQNADSKNIYWHYLQSQILSSSSSTTSSNSSTLKYYKQKEEGHELAQNLGQTSVIEGKIEIVDENEGKFARPMPIQSIEGIDSPPTSRDLLDARDEIQNEDQTRLPSVRCQVCDDAVCFAYYGVFTCNGCKGFFRRSILSNRRYNCREGGNCPITKEQRNFCRFCRLMKCLRVGMNVNAKTVQVQNDSGRGRFIDKKVLAINSRNASIQTNISFTNDYLKATELETEYSKIIDQFNAVTVLTSEALSALPLTHNAARLLRVESDVYRLKDTPRDLQKRFCFNSGEVSGDGARQFSFEFGFHNPELVTSRFPMCFKPKHIATTQLFIEGWRRYFTYYADWLRHVDDFVALSDRDQVILAKQRFASVGWMVCVYMTPACATDDIIAMCNCSYDHVQVAALSRISRDNTSKPSVSFYNARMYTMIKQLRRLLISLDLDLFEFVIFKAYLLFQKALGVSAEGHVQIRRAREKYTRIFYEYLCRKFARRRENPPQVNDDLMDSSGISLPNSAVDNTLVAADVFDECDAPPPLSGSASRVLSNASDVKSASSALTSHRDCKLAEIKEEHNKTPMERMSDILLCTAPFTTIRHMMAECVEIDRAFKMIGLDSLFFTTHDDDFLSS